MVKNITSDENRFKRTNVKKIASLKDLFSSPIKEVFFNVSSTDQVEHISKHLNEDGQTIININLLNDNKSLNFRLKKPRNLDRKTLNLLRKIEIYSTII